MTVNANFKTQVQARIDAVTGTTPLSDLIKLQTAARGLACNIAPLAAQINARLSAAGTATPLTDLAMMGILAEGNSRYAYYTVPFAVDKGDRLFIDAFGAVTKEPMRATATIGEAVAFFDQAAELQAIPQGSVVPSTNTTMRNAGAVLRLANGNHMVIRSYRESTNSRGSVIVQVLSADFSQLISQTTYNVSLAMSVNDVILIGAFEVSANTFRVYFLRDGGDVQRVVSFFSLAYNPTTHVVTGAAGSNVLSGALSAVYRQQHPHKQGDRYVIVSGSDTSTDVWRLDMQAGTATQTTVGAGAQFAAPDHSSATNVWTRMVIGSAVTMLRLDGTSNIALPANLTADGCFGAAWTVRHLGNRRWLTTNGAMIKLVTFGTDYTSCSIYTLDAAFGATGAISVGAVLVDGNRFYVAIGAATPVMISFVFTGAAAPTEYARLKTPASMVARIINRLSRTTNIAATDRVVQSLMFSLATGAGTRSLATYTAPASVYTGLQTRIFATCLNAATSGQTAEVELATGTALTTSALSTADIKRQQFLETELQPITDVGFLTHRANGTDFSNYLVSFDSAGRVAINRSAILLRENTSYRIGSGDAVSGYFYLNALANVSSSTGQNTHAEIQSHMPTLLLTQDSAFIASEEPLA